MEIKSLSNVPIETIYQAFLEAFFDYEVQIQMPLEKFQEMMQIRNLNPTYSLGCFENDRLVGFILCGYREIDRLKYCYDGGTGTVKEYRHKGIGNTLLQMLIKEFGRKGIDLFILEVLENNQAAIDLYAQNGFQKVRKLKCFDGSKNQLEAVTVSHNYSMDDDIENYRHLDYLKYLSFKPSWQNDKRSVENAIANYRYVALLHQDEVIGYGLIHKQRGDIPQIGILASWRDKGLESVIIRQLMERTESDRISILNVQENDYLAGKLTELGFKNFVNQYEMALDLTNVVKEVSGD